MLRTEPPRPGALVLGGFGSAIALAAVMLALGRPGHAHAAHRHDPGPPASASAGGPASGVPAPGDDTDDSDFDTIVLADPSDAPTPAPRGNHVSDVHPFAVVHLPRFGEGTGTIPDTPAGRALYAWLAAFNHADAFALAAAIPTAGPDLTAAAELATAAQMDLRRETGGFALLSAREIRPGLMVFRVRDQTTQTEALGTLQLRPDATAIQSLSLRAATLPATPKQSL